MARGIHNNKKYIEEYNVYLSAHHGSTGYSTYRESKFTLDILKAGQEWCGGCDGRVECMSMK